MTSLLALLLTVPLAGAAQSVEQCQPKSQQGRAAGASSGSEALDEERSSEDRNGAVPDVGPAATPELQPADEPLGPDEERPVPDYDRRPPPPTSTGDVLLWVPRALLLPAHLLLEYGLRRPLVGLGNTLEFYEVPGWVEWLLTWNEGRAGLLPILLFEYELDLAAGLLFFHRDLLVPGHDLSVRATVWQDGGRRVLATSELPLTSGPAPGPLSVSQSRTGGPPLLTSRLDLVTQRDWRFYGFGPDTVCSPVAFYELDLVEAQLGASLPLGGLSRFEPLLGYRHGRLDPGVQPALQTVYDVQDPRQVPGGFAGYDLLLGGATLVLDSRGPRPLYDSGTGLRLRASATYAQDLDELELRFVRWGGEAAGFLDVTGHGHVLAVRALAELVEPLGDEPVPFTEAVTLADLELLPGFRPGRMRGDSALVLTASYRYPVWAMAYANLFAGLGNTFRGRLEGLALKRLHPNFGLGLRSSLSRQASLELLLALGLSRLDSPDSEVEEVRFLFGLNRGF